VKSGSGSIGYAQILVCNVGAAQAACNESAPGFTTAMQPDVRLWSESRDVQCRLTGTPSGCVAGSDYNPNGASGPYTTICAGIAACGSGGIPVGPNGKPGPFCAPGVGSASACSAGADLTLTATHPGAALGAGLRITDINNGPGADLAATTADSGFPIPVDCLPTADASLGSACGVNTTTNALAPGAVRDGNAAVWQLGEIQVLDSGPNVTRGDGDDQPVAVQGIFLP
jgi:hypothetical protein